MHWSTILMAALFIIGITASLVSSPTRLIIPLVIFGGVFLLWKYPPARWRVQRRPTRSSPPAGSRGKSARDKRKQVPFKVIQGNKKDEKDPDPPYPYH